MNKLQQLIQQLCPDGVEWKTLGEVCDFQNGFAFRSDLFKNKGLPIVRITNIDGKNIDLEDVKYFDPNDYVNGNPLNYSIVKGDILIAMSGATTGKIGYYNLEVKAYLNQRVGKFIPNKNMLNNRFLYHYLLSKTNFFYNLAGGGAQPNLSSNSIKEKLSLPIPPLPVQTEIVRILDKFSTLTAELQAELQARKLQYEYYRNQLLDYSKGEVEWKTLGEVANIKNGKDWKQLKEGKYPVYGSGGIMCYVDAYAYNKPSVLIPRKGSLGNLFYIDTPFWNVDTIFYTEINDSLILPKFFYYFLTTVGLSNMNQAGGVPSQTQNALNRVRIPIPALAEQERIVAILDKFDTLTNSISEGLPKEIELRQKQYEYYRDMLLTFPQKTA